jgi:hypothetical protein
MIRYIIGLISLCLVGEGLATCSYTFMTRIAHRVERSSKLDTTLILLILGIVHDNPYVFRNLGSISNIAEYNIELNTSISVDQRRYNAPGMDQVAAIWVDGNNP